MPADLWPCLGDENQLGQAIDNIVLNAIQAMPGGGTIVVSAENVHLGHDEHPILRKGETT